MNFSKQPNEYHKALSQSLSHFTRDFHQYSEAGEEDRIRLRASMEEQLKLIFSAVSELKRFGISKEAAKLEKSYKAFIADESAESLAAVEHEIATLSDFNS